MSEVQVTRRLTKSELNSYINEIKYLKPYLISVILVVILSFSVYLFFDVKTVSDLGEENHLFEWLTVVFFLGASFFFLREGIKTRNTILIILSIAMFIGAGEEVSWGQSIFGWKTPEALEKINVQGETNFHNIIYVNSKDFNGEWKHGLQRIFEINFMFKVFVWTFGIILPLCVYHIKFISRLAIKFRIPVPPVSIGVFFFLCWLIQSVIRKDLVPSDAPSHYRNAAQEIFECLEAFILFILALYFYRNRKIMTFGKDIKQII